MQGIYEQLISLTDSFAKKYLNEEYAELARYAAAALCRKKPSPITRGKLTTWACGIIHALGVVNFLQDRSSKPYVSSADLYKAFDVAESTGQGKSKIIRDLLGLGRFDHEWTLPANIQIEAYNKGFIPKPPILKELEEKGFAMHSSKLHPEHMEVLMGSRA